MDRTRLIGPHRWPMREERECDGHGAGPLAEAPDRAAVDSAGSDEDEEAEQLQRQASTKDRERIIGHPRDGGAQLGP